MIKVTFQQMQGLNQNPTLMNKLFNTPLEAKLSYDLKKIMDALGLFYKDAAEKFHAERAEIQKKYCKLDEKGELVIDPKGECEILEGNHEAIEAEMGKLVGIRMQTAFTVDREPIAIERLLASKHLNISVSELAQIEPFVVDESDAKKEAEGKKKDNVTPIRPGATKETETQPETAPTEAPIEHPTSSPTPA